MKSVATGLFLALGLFFHSSSAIFAQPPGRPDKQKLTVSSEFGYTGESRFHGRGEDDRIRGTVDSSLKVSMRHPFSDWLALNLSAGWQRFDFSMGDSSGYLPNSLQTTSLTVGGETMLSRVFSFNLSLTGAFSGDSNGIEGGDFHFSSLALVGIRQTRALTWAVGLSVDPVRDYPVLPALGLIWKISPKVTLGLGVPKSELRFNAGNGWTLSALARIKGGTFRMGQDFGRKIDGMALEGEWMTYRDIRVGGRISREIRPGFEWSAEAGAAVLREFHYKNGARFTGSPAVYGSVGLSIGWF